MVKIWLKVGLKVVCDLRSRRSRLGWRYRLRFLGRFRIKVSLEVFTGDARVYTADRHVHFCDPENRVQHSLAEVFVAPVFVEMRPSEAEAAPLTGPLESPGKVLHLAAFDHFAHSRVAL